MMEATQFIEQGLRVNYVLQQVGLSASTWYYRCTGGHKGRTTSTHTCTVDNEGITNTEVVDII